MSKKSVLGRGLASLIPEAAPADEAAAATGHLEISIDLIDVNHLQPRKHFDEGKLEDLTNSIRESGILQPLIVSPGVGGRYELIAGERRLRASRRVGLQVVPVVVRAVSEDELLELALVENIQRDELNAIELALAFKQLQERFGYSHEQVAKRVGKDRSTVTNHLRLLNLPDEVQEAVVSDLISMGHARSIAGLKTGAEMLRALEKIVAGDLNVRQTERLVKAKKGDGGDGKAGPPRDLKPLPTDWSDIGRRLERAYSTRVKLVQKGKGGSLQLDFSSVDELNRILDRMLS